MIDRRKKQKDFLTNSFNDIALRINKFQELDQGFKLKDLLDDEHYYYYYIYIVKGIILCLINNGNIEIFSLYNGNKNYIYRCIKKIELKYNK